MNNEFTLFIYSSLLIAYFGLFYLLFHKMNVFLAKESPEHFKTQLVCRATKYPLVVLAVVVPLCPAILYLQELVGFEGRSLKTLMVVFHLSVLTWWLHNVIAAFEGYFLRKPDRDQTTASAVAKVAKIVLYSISGMVFLSQLGVNLSAIMTFSGMSGLALGFAAKDIVANFMSSLVIHWENQIKLGQWISSPDEDIEGIVRAINMRTVEIERFDKYPMFIPTSKIVSMSISNHSRMTNRRINEHLGVRIMDVKLIPVITEKLQSYINDSILLDQRHSNFVYLNKVAASSMDLWVNLYSRSVDWVHFQSIKQQMLLEMIEIIEGCGAELAYDVVELKDLPENTQS
ncbi:mechanosensitive ion channel domain-containing protein [Vibrio breoganii]|uniref:mechanosensitive ion channel family protein n=2 Tax=Vibrio TaxID=662 RepID=UPI000C843F39|nr:mechanosensitive ion channel domain-containing protein [Vibrio breoganii]PML10941.1 hypothetical protein BCT84_03505 [Vibrio breoganii]